MGSPQSVVRSLLATALLLAAMPAQQLPHVVRGKATDELGQPLAGVEVNLLVKWCANYSPFANAVLQTGPLPKGRSDADGNWVLAIPWPLLAIASRDEGMFVLEARLADRQPWRELVAPPLDLWSGDDVALPPLRDVDLASIHVSDPQPGMLLCVERIDSLTGQTDGPPRPELQLLEVPADGRVSVHVPLLPNPVALDPAAMFRPLGWQVRLVGPGRSTEAVGIDPGAVVEFSAPTAPRPTRPVARSDQQPVRGLRVLLKVAEDDLRWLPVAGDAVPVDEASPPLAVVADHCAAIPFGDDLMLSALAAGSRTVRIATAAGGPAQDFEAMWIPLRQALAATPDQLLRSGRLLHGNRDELELPDAGEEPGLLQLRLPGCATARVFDPRGRTAPGVLRMQAEEQATLMIRVLDDAERPVPGALLEVITFQDGVSPYWQPPGREPAVTAANGTARCEAVPVGRNLQVQATAPGSRRGGKHGVTVAPQQVHEITLHLQRLTTWRLRTVDAAGAVVPFAAIGYEIRQETEDGSFGTRCILTANARGAAVLQAEPDPPPGIVPGRFGSFEAGEQKLTPASPRGDVVVRRRPILAVRVPEMGQYLDCELEWQRPLVGTSRSFRCFQPARTRGLLLEWPEELVSCWFDCPVGQPVQLCRDDLAAGAPRVELDRRAVHRRLPLRLLGDPPGDLHTLRAPLRGTRDQGLSTFRGDSIGFGADGSPQLLARDDREHPLWLFHPDCVPLALTMPAASIGATEVVATVQRGAPLRITVTLKQPLHDLDRVVFDVETSGLFGKQIGTCRLLDPALAAAQAGAKLLLQAPFALPPGKLLVSLWSDRGACKKRIEVVGTAPLEVDLGEW